MEDIAATIVTEGLEDMAQHFLPRERRWCRDWRTWGILQKGREVRSRTYYILGTDFMSPSVTLGTTRTIIWYWVDCQAPP